MASRVFNFIHELHWDYVPDNIKAATRYALLDLLGVAASGTETDLSKIIRNHAVSQFGCSDPAQVARILFDGRQCSVSGAALAGGMLIDSVDAHDGYKPTKGHIGCGVLPAVLAFAEIDEHVSEAEFLCRILMGYEVGGRAGIALHKTACDYHTSGAWIALASAAVGARSLHLDQTQSREAVGIAEYHGPRSQMMRCIDHPTMLKDGSGWGAMAGCSAALLAKDGFTGAPAVTIEGDDVRDIWADIGSNWIVTDQYVKAYPVCRWAQPAIAGVLAIKDKYDFLPEQVKRIEIGTFHESKRLAVSSPMTTEQAQYSLPFPVAAAVVYNDVSVEHIDGAGLKDDGVLRLSNMIEMVEVDDYNQCFPDRRKSHVVIELNDGQVLESGTVEAAGDPEMPFSTEMLERKFMRFASGPLGESRATTLKECVLSLANSSGTGDNNLEKLKTLIYQSAANKSFSKQGAGCT